MKYLTATPYECYYFYSYFTDEGTEAERSEVIFSQPTASKCRASSHTHCSPAGIRLYTLGYVLLHCALARPVGFRPLLTALFPSLPSAKRHYHKITLFFHLSCDAVYFSLSSGFVQGLHGALGNRRKIPYEHLCCNFPWLSQNDQNMTTIFWIKKSCRLDTDLFGQTWLR